MKQPKALGVFSLTMINLAAILSLRNLPLLSAYGCAMIFFYLLAAGTFFIPIALVAAELASLMPEEGGMYVWIHKAIGHKTAFLAIWLSLVTTVTALTLTLLFTASALAVAINPSLTDNHFFVCSVVLLLTWSATILSLRGIRVSSIITAIASILGTIVPGLLIMIFGLYWWLSGRPLQFHFSLSKTLPDFSNFANISFLAGIMFAFAGIEIAAYHIRDVENPRKNFPRAIFYSALLILFISILGSLAIGLIVPKEQLQLEAGVIQTLSIVLRSIGLDWLIPLLAFSIALGGISFIFAWIAGPARGLLATRKTGDLPLFLQKTNRWGMPSRILLLQACVVTLLSLFFLWLPSLSLGFWILNASSAIMALVAYFFLFLSGPILRKKMPDAPRLYRVPCGNWGMTLLTAIGSLNIFFCLIIGFILPRELQDRMTQAQFFFVTLAVTALLSAPPFFFFLFKKPSWKNRD